MKTAVEIRGAREFTVAGAKLADRLLTAVLEAGGSTEATLAASLGRGEVPALVLTISPDATPIIELVTRDPASCTFTSHCLIPMLKLNPGAAPN